MTHSCSWARRLVRSEFIPLFCSLHLLHAYRLVRLVPCIPRTMHRPYDIIRCDVSRDSIHLDNRLNNPSRHHTPYSIDMSELAILLHPIIRCYPPRAMSPVRENSPAASDVRHYAVLKPGLNLAVPQARPVSNERCGDSVLPVRSSEVPLL